MMCAVHGQRPLMNSMTLVLHSSTPQPSAFPTPCPPPPAAVHSSLHNKQHQESLSFTWERTARTRVGVRAGQKGEASRGDFISSLSLPALYPSPRHPHGPC